MADYVASAGPDQNICLVSGNSTDVYLDGSGSLDPDGGTIVWYNWDLSAFGVANVSANITDVNEISATMSAVSAIGTYDVGMTVSASTLVTYDDTTRININRQPTASAGQDQNVTQICDSQYHTITLSGQSDTPGATYVWYFEDGAVTEIGQIVTREYVPGTYSAGLEVYLDTSGVRCTSDQDSVSITVNESELQINTFAFDPDFENSVAEYVWTTLSWEITSAAVSAVIDNDVGVIATSALTSGSLLVSASNNISYNVSAFDVSGCMITSVANAIINLSLQACVIKTKYIELYGPDDIRWGDCRNINLVDMLPNVLDDTDTSNLVSVYEEYLNEIYSGKCGYTIATSALSTTACDSSACSLSAVDNWYEHDTYISSADSTSANELRTPGDDVKRSFIDNFCQIPKENISVLEKTNRLTELFDPDLIPIELIQFYAANLGYEVGLSRDNVGINSTDTQTTEDIINQKKYLRFMVRNLPTWYKIKTTRNSVKMMLYSFGLVGDFIYYFTRNYLDPTTGIGLNTLEYGGQDVNNYGGQDVNNYGISGTSGFNVYVINDNMTYKEVQELKCNLSQWEEFKENKKAYFNMLNDLQAAGNNDWMLTETNPISSKEDISNIPDNFFSTPHFRLWFDILESMTTGNYSTDLHKQKLISEAIKAIKPINTVFEGVTGVYRTLVDMYMFPYSRVTKHITLLSDGYADWFM